ncbi:MAG: UrcA family protein [Sphingomonas bacterium]
MLKLMIPALLLSAFAPNVALAQEDGHVAVHVAYRDLDLRSPAGVKQLDRRLQHAIDEVCPDFPMTDLARQRLVEKCRAAKWAAVTDQRATVLLHSGRGGAEVAATSAAR